MAHHARTVAKYVLAALALAAMLALAPFFVASGLMAPRVGGRHLLRIWLALFVLVCLWIRWIPPWVVPTAVRRRRDHLWASPTPHATGNRLEAVLGDASSQQQRCDREQPGGWRCGGAPVTR